jgi:hypothetical protein
MCPHCGRDAPIVYRGALPFCTACGRPRIPLSSPSINLAGKPSKLGGVVATIVGGAVLLVGLSIALGLGFLLNAIFTPAVGLAVALPIALIVLVVGVVLLGGGHSLRRSGAARERTTREQAMLALVAHRGRVTAADAALALGVGVAEADAMLTALAKREPEGVSVEVDDQGTVWYRAAGSSGEAVGRHVRVGENIRVGSDGDPSDVNVDVGVGTKNTGFRR